MTRGRRRTGEAEAAFRGRGGTFGDPWDEPAVEGAGSGLARGVAALGTLEPGR